MTNDSNIKTTKSKRRNFVVVDDGYMKVARQVDCDLCTAAKLFTDEYRDPNATNGAMVKVLEDLNGSPVDTGIIFHAEQTGEDFGYSLRISWTQDDLTHGGPKARIAFPGSYMSCMKTVNMDEFARMTDYTNSSMDLYAMISDASREIVKKAEANYVSQFDSIESMQDDIRMFDEKRESIFNDTFWKFYPSRIDDIKESVVSNFDKLREHDNDTVSRQALDDFSVGRQVDEFVPDF